MTRSWMLALCVVVACGKGGGTGGGSGGTAPASGDKPSGGGDCKTIAVCDAFPAAHVDALCGTKTAKTVVDHVDSTYITDQCTYQNRKLAVRAALKRGDDVEGSAEGLKIAPAPVRASTPPGHLMLSLGGSDKLGAYAVALDGVVDATDCNAK